MATFTTSVKVTLLLVLLTVTSMFAQTGACKQDVALSNAGRPLAGASILVCANNSSPCSPVTLFKDSALSQSLGNPFTTTDGYYSFCSAEGDYQVVVSFGAATSVTNDIHVGGAITGRANTWTATQTFKQVNSVRYADQYSGSDWGAKVAAALADCPTTGTCTIDASNFTSPQSMSANLTISRSGTTVLFGLYQVNQGSNSIIVPSPASNVQLIGATPWGTTPSAAVNGTTFSYTGTGSAHQLGDASATSYGHLVRDINFAMGSAGAGAVALTSTRVFGTELSRLRANCTAAANTVTFIKLDGTSTAPGGQSVFLQSDVESNCNTGVLVTGSTSPPLENNILFFGGQFSGNGLTGGIAIDIEAGNDIDFEGAYVGGYDIPLKVASPSAGAVFGKLHAESCTTGLVFTAGTGNSNLWTDTSCTITDSGTNNHIFGNNSNFLGLTTVPAITSSGLITSLGGGFKANTSVAFTTQHMLMSASNPTISSGFGTSPTVTSSNGTPSFTITVGTGGTASSGVITLPAASAGWNCSANDRTTPATNLTRQSDTSTTTATLTNYNNSGVATAWPAGDLLGITCSAY